MKTKILFLAWQGKKGESRLWFPVARIDVEPDAPHRFRYTKGANRAKKEARFRPFIDFPYLKKEYRSADLLSLFHNRIVTPTGPDFAEQLQNLALPKGADPIEVPSTYTGAQTPDSYEIFSKLEKDKKGRFSCRFFLHGWREANEFAQKRIDTLEVGETLYLTIELPNQATRLGVQVQTKDYHIIGWTPHYLVDDVTTAIAESNGEYEAEVIRIDPQPPPSKQRILVEMRGRWNTHEPMSSKDFELLVD